MTSTLDPLSLEEQTTPPLCWRTRGPQKRDEDDAAREVMKAAAAVGGDALDRVAGGAGR